MKSSSEPKWLTAEEQHAWRSYLWAWRQLEVALETDLQAAGVSLSEYELLSMLSEAPGDRMRMSALADFIVQSRSRVTHTSNRLEKRGFVRREPAPDDGRGIVLILTPEGRTQVEELAARHVASVREHFVDVLSSSQLRRVGQAMTAVIEANPLSAAR